MKTISNILIRNGTIINRGERKVADVYIENGRIEKIDDVIDINASVELEAEDMFLIPGIIDDQVHFREPGLTHKADIYNEARAGVAGGVTSFMEMPNTKPPAITQDALKKKYKKAAKRSLANYSFYMGMTNDNIEEVLKTDPSNVCGVKAFMGSSTGNMLVDDPHVLEELFSKCPMLIATHCEDEQTIRNNLAKYRAEYGDDIPVALHPEIRSAEGCLKSSSFAVELAKKYGTRLHILHISTKDEISLFQNDLPLEEKRITAEVCVHHLYFNADDYERFGSKIKCNPAIKSREHQEALWNGLMDGYFDVIATDHAPHTAAEKKGNYMKAPSGVPLVQHSLNIMYEFCTDGKISLEKMVDKMCHAPARCFNIQERGYLDEGYWADVVLFDPDEEWTVKKNNLFYKCNWSPFEGHTFKGKVQATVVSGHLAYLDGIFFEDKMGERLLFDRL